MTAGPADSAAAHYRRAVELRHEIETTGDMIQIILRGRELRDELDEALRLNPDHVLARVQLVRYLVNAPAFAGGGLDAARAEAIKVAKLDPAAGHFASGYIAYRSHQIELARHELRAATETSKDSVLTQDALTWLGWVSQESHRWDEAFAAWNRLLLENPSRADALYEIGRTAVFCRCQTAAGETALVRYLRERKPEHRTEAEALLARLRANPD